MCHGASDLRPRDANGRATRVLGCLAICSDAEESEKFEHEEVDDEEVDDEDAAMVQENQREGANASYHIY